ncbi:phospho-sugar mutase [Buchananella hordeovulneris]|uniref:Phosphomannomutase n=1 Tax=Buchananella hordeovulneris TaxID=52770 RepID=A0A1Q5PYY4_9ACTO|nr:phospho-sugar mutase [Buchananella hordeovulneris]MDO5080748.1 phospho-sugar mutase [Buchananella hordeovulneris]OKL52841.1 phosphomannomutase [Buchananella hordeovulneris]
MVDFQAVRQWIATDPDPATRAELQTLLTAAEDGCEEARTELADRFSGTLQFGTAGLRGRLGGGPNRMNRAVVIRAAAGLTRYLLDTVPAAPVVVIGYDARHGSADFAADTAAVVTAAGGRALLLPRPLPTPVLAFAVRHLQADAGVMVTASHNPPQDNGYKVYLGGRAVTDGGQGAQIVSPHDVEIAARIAAAPAADAVARAADGWQVLGEEIVAAYLERLAQLPGTALPAAQAAQVRIVLTSMHGVGGQTCRAALQAAGFTDVHEVAEQAQPDPDFPTVAFPNPEEPGALDLAFALARSVQADLIIANDPDADRCSAAIADPQAPAGWRQLTGDEVGALLGQQAAALAVGGPRTVLASSVVSSRLLGRIAAAHGLEHVTTLTGFKWISRVEGLAFGYEEALGYCVDPAGVRDKDGISATVRLAALAAQVKAAGRSLSALLDELAVAHGLHATAPLSIRVADLSLIATGMANLRAQPPQELAGSPVTEVVDLSAGWQRFALPATDGMVLLTAAQDRVIVRPSGTEPKLKCYLEVITPVAGVEELPAARARAQARLAQLQTEIRAVLGI